MHRLTRLVIPAALAAAVSWSEAGSAQEFRIGVAAPLTGTSARLGAQVRVGAEAAAANVTPAATLDVVDDRCNAEGGAAAARELAERKAAIVVGFLCTEAIEAAMPILKDAGIPVITVGVRTNSLTDRRAKTGWPVFRLAPRADGEATAISTILVELWRSELFAIIDDGTIYGRELAEALRSEAERQALQPVYVDTFRPQLDNQIALAGRLRKAGATHVFVGGDLEDIAVLGRDAAEIEYPLTIAGGEALRSAATDVPLQAGTLMIGLPEWAEIASPPALAAIMARGVEAEGYSLPAYAAIEIAAKILAETQAVDAPLQDRLLNASFTTAIGTVGFDAKGDLQQSPYRLFRYDGTKFVEVGEE